MKKHTLTLIAVLSTVNFTYAQWTISGTNIYNSNTGNVGIGITVPANILSVAVPAGGTVGDLAPLITGQKSGYSNTGGLYNTLDAISPYAAGLAFKIYKQNVGMTEAMRISSTGNVGIGTTTPLTRLHVTGNGSSIDGGNNFQINGDDLVIQGNTGGRSATTGAQLEFVIPANTDGTNLWGQARIITVAGSSGNGDATGKMILGTRRSFNKLGLGSQWYYGNDLIIDGSGNVGINTIDTKGYQFAVNGNAIATSMTVKLYANWPDYVFKPNYHLPLLSDVKTYIDQNHHLPEMPSEQEIAKDGLNLGDMNKILVKKVEELTLYLIEKDKAEQEQKALNKKQSEELKAQRDEINIQNEKLKQLEARLESLETAKKN